MNKILLMFCLIIIGCTSHNGIDITVNNKTNQNIRAVSISGDGSLKDNPMQLLSIAPLDAKNTKASIFGAVSIIVIFKNGDRTRTSNFGYYEPSFNGKIIVDVISNQHIRVTEKTDYSNMQFIADYINGKEIIQENTNDRK